MPTLDEIRKSIFNVQPSVISIGNFDGVHRGHQTVFENVVSIAKSKDLKSIVFVLFPHPKEVFSGSSPALLTTLVDRKKLIESYGIDAVYDLTFDAALAETTHQDLLESFGKDFGMKHLVIGPTTHIGKNREGNPEKIGKLNRSMNFGLSVVRQTEIAGYKLSSSLIRSCIAEGKVNQAREFLDRFYTTQGIVETGQGKGRTIGFPTANVAQIQTLVPGRGVYAGYAHLDKQRCKAAINVGMRPTISSDKTLVVEAHLIDFDKKIVGQSMVIEWVERLRDEVKFQSIEELKIQILRDVGKANDVL